ncbi:alpha-L RNA-binding motif-containing protein [Conidiobolus coronatus NRRL 28638]|uniref:Alpha-L RNA-binding motif-containing protein n=1 Tax=Conidiobolus coronatus (strain ATCC 28846 / CBS 209.66 / NRRL 28638) TaxID=796925 RepID=A0A137P6K2_CONC2|nr:alpha-L RNA-binding motif-containing protein [Conidiobolus coronatus NRRL 28638]|eukprot:KXN70632.1 alpha-L RNA-binding motif-containing protein [Conidiobolus coronatus NRRL 28638]
MVKPKIWYSTGRGLVRMSWNKYNVYNLVHQPNDIKPRDTVFQQHWKAKKATRSYHDADITERQWKKIFHANSKLPSANTGLANKMRDPYGPNYTQPDKDANHPAVAALTYAELERRVDFILFRSHFAPSVYAARQLILHGKVFLNGEKCRDTGLRVKDMDLIRVQPEAVCTLKGDKNSNLNFSPKPYSQPFMFLPDYLEVDYKTCSVVFLRQPTSRPRVTEVPSPFNPNVHKLAYEYYITNK